MIPYYFYDGTYAVFLALLNRKIGWRAALQSNLYFVIIFLGLGACWFLACMFFVKLVFLFLYQKAGHAAVWIAFGLFAAGLLSAPYADMHTKVMVRCLIGIGFFAIRFLLKDVRWQIKNSRAVLPAVLCAGVYLFLAFRNGEVHLISLKIGNPLLFAVNGVLGTAIVLSLSYSLHERLRLPSVFKLLELFGKQSLFILGSHVFVIEVIRLLDYKIFDNLLYRFGIFEGFVFGAAVCSLEYLAIPHYVKIKQYLNEKYRMSHRHKMHNRSAL